MFAAALPLLYMAVSTKHQLRILSLLLGGFALFHGLYHSAFLLGQGNVGVELIEPVAVVLLLTFAGYYWKRGIP